MKLKAGITGGGSITESGDITLFDALNTYISRIKSRYDSDWLITDDAAHITFRKSSIPHSKEHFFERVTDLENHLYTELCICMEGSFAMQMGEHIVDVNEGELCILFPGVLHAELHKKDSDYLAIWISVNYNIIALHLSGQKSDDGLFYTLDGCTIKSSFDNNPVLAGMIEEIACKKLHYMEIAKLNVLKLLVTILREMGDPHVSGIGNKSWKQEVVIRIQNYIKENYNRSIRLSDISQELFISPNYINTIFKSITGKTIIHYVEDFKIDKARELLKVQEYSISSIAFKLGYYDQYHFSKIFKKETGVTPSQFRKLL